MYTQIRRIIQLFNDYDLQNTCWAHLITRKQIINQKYEMKIKRHKIHMNSGLHVANRMEILEDI